MASIRDQLDKLSDGKSKIIRGITVTKVSDEYLIDGDHLMFEEAVSHISESGAKKTKGIDYSSIALLIVKPPSRVISSHRAKNRADHRKILDMAFKKQCFVYFANVEHRDGKYYATQPWIVDWDSVDALYDQDGKPKVEFKDEPKRAKKKLTKKERDERIEKANKPGLFCPYCDHPINSTPGRTLHVKSKHPDKLEEYQEWLKSHGKS